MFNVFRGKSKELDEREQKLGALSGTLKQRSIALDNRERTVTLKEQDAERKVIAASNRLSEIQQEYECTKRLNENLEADCARLRLRLHSLGEELQIRFSRLAISEWDSIISVEDLVEEKIRREAVEAFISNMTIQERYKKIIRLRFGLDGHGEKTYSEIARMLGVSRGRVHQIVDNFFRHARYKIPSNLK
jgi:RNA polymerase sigma factor (sigma-70 family)